MQNTQVGANRAKPSLLTAATREEMAQRAKHLRKNPHERKAQKVVPDFGGVPNFAKGEVLFPHQADTLHVMHGTDRGQGTAEVDSFILDVTPGGGKTRLSCADMLIGLSKGTCRKPLVLMPRGLLQQQKQEMLGFTKGAPKIDTAGESVADARKNGGPVFQVNKDTGEIRSFAVIDKDGKPVHEAYLKDKNWSFLHRRVQAVELVDGASVGRKGRGKSNKVRVPVYGIAYDQPINVVAIGSATVTRKKGAPFDFNPETGAKRRGAVEMWSDEKVQALIEGAPPNTIFITSYSFLTQASSSASPTIDGKTGRWKDRQITFNPTFADKPHFMKMMPGFPIDDPEASWEVFKACRPFCEWLVQSEFTNSKGELVMTDKETGARTAPKFWDGTTDSQFAIKYPQWVWLLQAMDVHHAQLLHSRKSKADKDEDSSPLAQANDMFRAPNKQVKQPPFKLVQSRSAAFLDAGVDYVLLDESHKVKNEGSSITEAMKVLDDPRVKTRRIASGTIMPNQPMDVLAQLKWLCPLRDGNGMVIGNKIFGSDEEFLKTYTMTGEAVAEDNEDSEEEESEGVGGGGKKSSGGKGDGKARKNTSVIWKDPVIDTVYDPATDTTREVSAHGLKVAREKLAQPFVVRDSEGKALKDSFGKAVWTGPIGVSHRQSSWGYLMPEKEEHFHFATLTEWQQEMYDALIDCMNLDFLWEDRVFYDNIVGLLKDRCFQTDDKGKVLSPKVLTDPPPATSLLGRMPVAEQFFVASEAIDLVDATARTVAGFIDDKQKKLVNGGTTEDFDLAEINDPAYKKIYSRIVALVTEKQPKMPTSGTDTISTKVKIIDDIIRANMQKKEMLPVLDSAGNAITENGQPKMREQVGKVIVFIGYYAGLQSMWENSEFGAKSGVSAKYSPTDDPDGLQKFKKDPAVKVLFAMQGSLREGHNLQMANCVIMTVPPHAPGDNDQLLARAYRPGQKMKVNVHHVLSEAHEKGTYGPTDILKFCRMCAKMQEIAMLNSDYNNDASREVATQSFTKFNLDNLMVFKHRDQVLGGAEIDFAYGAEYQEIRRFERTQFKPKLDYYGNEMYDVSSDVDISKDGFALRMPTLGEPINGELDIFDNGPDSIDVTSTVPMGRDKNGKPLFWKDARAEWKNATGLQFDTLGTPVGGGSAGWASEEEVEAARQARFTTPSFAVGDWVFAYLTETIVEGQLPTVGRVVEVVVEELITSWLATRGENFNGIPSRLYARNGGLEPDEKDLMLLDTADGAIVLRPDHKPVLAGRPVIVVQLVSNEDSTTLNNYNVRGRYGLFDPKSKRISFPKAERELVPGTFVQLIDRDPDSIVQSGVKNDHRRPAIGSTKNSSGQFNTAGDSSTNSYTSPAGVWTKGSVFSIIFKALMDVNDWVVMPRPKASTAADAAPYGAVGNKYKPDLLKERYLIRKFFSKEEILAVIDNAIGHEDFSTWASSVSSEVDRYQRWNGTDHGKGSPAANLLYERFAALVERDSHSVVDKPGRGESNPKSAHALELMVSRCHIKVTQRPTSAFDLDKYGKKDLYEQVDKEVDTFTGLDYVNMDRYCRSYRTWTVWSSRHRDDGAYETVYTDLLFDEVRAQEIVKSLKAGEIVVQTVVSVKNVFDVKSIRYGRLAGYVPPVAKAYNAPEAAAQVHKGSLTLLGDKGFLVGGSVYPGAMQQGDPLKQIVGSYIKAVPLTKTRAAAGQAVTVLLYCDSPVYVMDAKGEVKKRQAYEFWLADFAKDGTTAVANHVGYAFQADMPQQAEEMAQEFRDAITAGSLPTTDAQAWMCMGLAR